MRKLKTFSIVLLTLYAFVQLHGIIPHNHDDANHEQVVHFDSHNHEHHHGHFHNHTHDFHLLDFLMGLLDNITHIDLGEKHLEDYINERNEVVNYSFFVTAVTRIYNTYVSTCIAPDVEISEYGESPPILYEYLRSGSLDLRGPPTLS